ncbi:hypothetical protein KCM76_25100 [Zooshikella marina]|uniref:hypothetical protein n=1 Tax=Zooshikella ganghwensis TaxID=202772 RepID=UPI001BAFDD91|nr:hypothetical protein [Zooshikella ganghwensis]MBU2709298.1 hypothetical protein [Zooshikella ganghwensis]
MKNTLLVIVLSVVLAGCGVNVKRTVKDNILVSNASPAIRLNIPQPYELVNSTSGKKFNEYDNGFSGSYDNENSYLFLKKSANGYVDGAFYVAFVEAGAQTMFIDELKDKELFNSGNMQFRGFNYKTYFKVGKLPRSSENSCFIQKMHRKVLPPNKSRLFVMVYSEVISCDKLNTEYSRSQVISEVDARAFEFMNSL